MDPSLTKGLLMFGANDQKVVALKGLIKMGQVNPDWISKQPDARLKFAQSLKDD